MGAAGIAQKDGRIVIWTEAVRKEIGLDCEGRFALRSFVNVKSGLEYVRGRIASDEFQFRLNGEALSGATPGWSAGELSTETLAQGEIHGWITLSREGVRVTRHYVAYPGTGFVQEWTVYKNTGADGAIEDPSIFVQRLSPGGERDVDFAYMTGGANFTGATILKTADLKNGYVKDFDSNGPPEMIEMDGMYADKRHQRYNGAGIWFPFMAMRNRKTGDGWVLHFDYQGWWTARFTSRDGVTGAAGECKLVNYKFPAGGAITSPKATIGAFTGDWDDLGNDTNNYIYQYKWDYTRDKYFNRTNFGIWRAAPLTDKVFRMVEMARYIGSERVWVDDFWFDAKGNYNGVFGDDWRHINEYINKNGMLFRLWMPPWHADRLSQVWLDHPDWMIDFHGNWYNWTIDMSREEAYQWVLGMLKRKQEEFGTYDLRVDGDPCNLKNDGSFDISYEGDWNASFLQSQNFYRLYKEFKDQNPDAGIDGCSSGGHTISIESVRYTDQQQITDGMCMHMGGYWTTMLMPIDKHQGMPICGNRSRTFTEATRDCLDLFSAPAMFNQNPQNPYTLEALESMRKDVELFYWLRAQGVYGRWIQVFRPALEHGDPTFVLQRMTKDLSKGVIMISQWSTNPMLGKSETIYPKGLLPDNFYRIESIRGCMEAQTKAGAEWMKDGIKVGNVLSGEYLLINLPGRPGCGDMAAPPPGAPSGLAKSRETWLGRDGVGVSWTAPDAGGRIIHYEAAKNGAFFTKVSSGTYLFDDGGAITDVYGIRTVDENGLASPYAEI